MSDFKKWFENQYFYKNMRFIYGDALFDKDADFYRVLAVQIAYEAWSTQRQRSKDEFIALTQEWHTKGWGARQDEIDQLTTMNQRYIGKMQEQQDQIAELEKQIAEISSYATELAEYTSYAEIIGSVLHNRKVIREYCDKIFAYNRAVDAEEEKALRGEYK